MKRRRSKEKTKKQKNKEFTRNKVRTKRWDIFSNVSEKWKICGTWIYHKREMWNTIRICKTKVFLFKKVEKTKKLEMRKLTKIPKTIATIRKDKTNKKKCAHPKNKTKRKKSKIVEKRNEKTKIEKSKRKTKTRAETKREVKREKKGSRKKRQRIKESDVEQKRKTDRKGEGEERE